VNGRESYEARICAEGASVPGAVTLSERAGSTLVPRYACVVRKEIRAALLSGTGGKLSAISPISLATLFHR
jgi:hypothetical protein